MSQFLKIFYRLECLRLDYCIKRDLPGLWAQQLSFRSREQENIDIWNLWKDKSKILSSKQSTSFTSLSLTDKLINDPLPILEIFQHEFQIQELREIMESKTEAQKEDFRASLQKFLDENLGHQEQGDSQKQQMEIDKVENDQTNERPQYELSVNGERLKISQNLSDTIGAIIKDLGYLPDDYLKPNSNGRYVDQYQNKL